MKQDLSYGIYLYGFPMTQAVVALLLPPSWATPRREVSFAVIFPLVLLLTGSFASLSWDYIEKPALRLRHLWVRKPRHQAAIA